MSHDRPSLSLVPAPGDVGRAPPEGDDALMALAAAGDRRAFGRLVARHEAALVRLATLLVVDAERARELAQDALVLAWERRARYTPTGPVRAWLAGFVRNLARRERRRQRVRAFFGLALAPAWTEPEAPGDGFAARAAADRDRVLAAALTKLPPAMHEALAMRFVAELSYDEMAALTGTSASTLRSRVHHGLARLSPHVPEELLR